MAEKQTVNMSYETLVGMIPIVMDFLDVDSEDIMASGILDDDRLDDSVAALILIHAKSLNNRYNAGRRTRVEDLTEATDKGKMSPNPSKSEHHLDSFSSQFRMKHAVFEALLHDVMTLTSFAARANEGIQEASSPLPMPPSSMLKLTLRFLGTQQTTNQLAASANISGTVYSLVVHETMEALYELLQYYIQWPDSSQIVDICSRYRDKYGLKNVLGVIDALHIQVKAPEEHINYYTNQQMETTVVLQTVCDHRLRFLHCCTGWPGSMGEETVLRDSDLHNDVQDQADTYFPFNTYLIGDEAYPLTPWLVTPFPDSTNLSSSEQQFNSACRLVLQDNAHLYTLLMQRFPRLEYVEMKDMQSMVVTILVCCALHNFCIDKGDMSTFKDEKVLVRNINNATKAGSDNQDENGKLKQKEVLQQMFK